jgi:hypothetical protein
MKYFRIFWELNRNLTCLWTIFEKKFHYFLLTFAIILIFENFVAN